MPAYVYPEPDDLAAYREANAQKDVWEAIGGSSSPATPPPPIEGLATQEEAEAGVVNNKWMSPLRTKQAIDQLGGGGPAGSVSSVNSQTGAVVLSAGDVGAATTAQGALADTAVQPGDNVSDLTNDAGYITLAEVPPGGVTSVNTQTGDVVLAAADVGAATTAQGALADSAVQPGDLATVATSGDYDDLSNKPTLGTAASSNIGDFAAASHTHTAADINSGATADGTFLQADGSGGAYFNNISLDQIEDVPTTFPPSSHAASHATGGSDAITPSNIGAANISHTHTAADLIITQNDIPETFVEDEITSTNSASPTEISLQSYYSVAKNGLRVRVMLEATVDGSHGAVRLPELYSNSTGFVTVRLNTGVNLGRIKVTLTDQAQTPIYPASGYDEIAPDTDYTFRWIGDRWEMDIRPNESATIAHSLIKPDHSGVLAAFRSYSPPLTPTSPGQRGQLAFGYSNGAERLYICIGDNVWRRVLIATWS